MQIKNVDPILLHHVKITIVMIVVEMVNVSNVETAMNFSLMNLIKIRNNVNIKYVI